MSFWEGLGDLGTDLCPEHKRGREREREKENEKEGGRETIREERDGDCPLGEGLGTGLCLGCIAKPPACPLM